MVQRNEKRNRRYLGARRWGAGNIKNNRGAGDRGGVGKGGKKGKFTYAVVYDKESLYRHGFHHWKKKDIDIIDLDKVSKIASKIPDAKPTVELKGCKVLSTGTLEKPVIVKASAFSKLAIKKIKKAGGDAIAI